MKVLISRHAGFCWGVRRAMDAAIEASARFGHRGPVSTLGPLVHNAQALGHLKRRGILQADSPEGVQQGTVVIRAHGIPLQDFRTLKSRRSTGTLRIFNATCPEVGRVQAIIRRFSGKGRFVIILGSAEHPEVIAHRSFATCGSQVLSSVEEAALLPDEALVHTLVVAQTTFDASDFRRIAEHLKGRNPSLVVKETICRDTLVRQCDAESLVERAQTVVVVGGLESNNTRHLAALARRKGRSVHHVESAMDLDPVRLEGVDSVVVLAGASTPNWTVDEVVEKLERIGKSSSSLRSLLKAAEVVRLPLALVTGGSAWILNRALGWGASWVDVCYPILFVLGVSALAPFVDPLGLGTKGQVREGFLAENRRAFLGGGTAILLLAFGLVASNGVRGGLGMAALAFLALLYPRTLRLGPVRWSPRRMPASKDLGQSLGPSFLVLVLPLFQGSSAPAGLLLTAFMGMTALFMGINGWRHVREFQKDQVLGPETLPVALGIRNAKAVGTVCLLAGVMALGWVLK